MRFKNTPWLSALLLAAGLSALPVLLFSLPVPVYIPLLAASASSLSAALTAERKRFWAAPALWMLLCAATLLLARDGVAPLLDSLLTAWQQLHPRIYPAYAAADSAARLRRWRLLWLRCWVCGVPLTPAVPVPYGSGRPPFCCHCFC